MKINDLSYNQIEELILLALTYRISYQNMAKLLKTDSEDIESTFNQLEKYEFPLYILNNETINEEEINARVAYVKGYQYLKKRKLLYQQLGLAKKKQDNYQIAEIRNEIKEHMHLIDDYVVSKTLDKRVQELTEEEKEAIARFRLKYAVAFRNGASILKRSHQTLNKMETELALKNPIFKEKIERFNDYCYKNNQIFIKEYVRKLKMSE